MAADAQTILLGLFVCIWIASFAVLMWALRGSRELRVPRGHKLLMFELDERMDQTLDRLCREFHCDRVRLFALAVAMTKIVGDEIRAGNKFVLMDEEGRIVKEIVLPAA